MFRRGRITAPGHRLLGCFWSVTYPTPRALPRPCGSNATTRYNLLATERGWVCGGPLTSRGRGGGITLHVEAPHRYPCRHCGQETSEAAEKRHLQSDPCTLQRLQFWCYKDRAALKGLAVNLGRTFERVLGCQLLALWAKTKSGNGSPSDLGNSFVLLSLKVHDSIQTHNKDRASDDQRELAIKARLGSLRKTLMGRHGWLDENRDY